MRKIQTPNELGCLSPACSCHSNSFHLLPHLEAPQYFIHPNTLWHSLINTLHWSRDCSPEVSEMSSWNMEGVLPSLPEWTSNPSGHWDNLGGKTERTTSQPTSQATLWACFCKCHTLGPRASLKPSRKETTWIERRQASQESVLGQVPGREGWWDEWEFPSSTWLSSSHQCSRCKWCSKGLWGQSGGKWQFYKMRGGKTGFLSLANGACERRW